MKGKYKFAFITFCITLIVGCNLFETTVDKQVKVCEAKVKISLEDPKSLEMLSKEGFDLDNGWYRLRLYFTAKNSMGGRVRGNTICGFINKNSTELNPEDFINQYENLKSLGIN